MSQISNSKEKDQGNSGYNQQANSKDNIQENNEQNIQDTSSVLISFSDFPSIYSDNQDKNTENEEMEQDLSEQLKANIHNSLNNKSQKVNIQDSNTKTQVNPYKQKSIQQNIIKSKSTNIQLPKTQHKKILFNQNNETYKKQHKNENQNEDEKLTISILQKQKKKDYIIQVDSDSPSKVMASQQLPKSNIINTQKIKINDIIIQPKKKIKVNLNIYLLSSFNKVINFCCCMQPYHSGVQIINKEYSFGSKIGVCRYKPLHAEPMSFYKSIPMGETDMKYSEIVSFIYHLAEKYEKTDYHLLKFNCNHFTNLLCQKLTGKSVPKYLTSCENCLLPFICCFPEKVLKGVYAN